MVTRPVESWGRLRAAPHAVVPLFDRDCVSQTLQELDGAAVVFGNGRSYGDVCLNDGGTLLDARGLDRFIAFDTETGIIECEAGVLLEDLIRVALPRGWFPMVTPGTQMVTLGGAVANDVHGKNHHRDGSFGNHLLGLMLARSDGRIIECSPHQHPEWFAATVGGMGLTGVIVSARVQLKRVAGGWLNGETLTFDDLDEFFALSRESAQHWEYVVSWVDCVGGRNGGWRGVFFRGNHTPDGRAIPVERKRTLLFTPPFSLVNPLSLRVFNEAYFRLKRARAGIVRQAFRPFFYPLDGLHHWNRMYGPRGFFQYQCVIPARDQEAGIRTLLAEIRRAGTGSFLAVLKVFGERPPVGLMSFPLHGATLALDFPNRGEATQRLFDRLNSVVEEAGGRLYPAKDACMPRRLFEKGYPRLAEFSEFRDPAISSSMSRRLTGF